MQERARVVTTVLLFWLFTASAFATDFASSVSYPVGMAPHPVVTADFNGDGKLDIAVANSGSGDVSILIGKGDGTFQGAANYDAGVANPLALSRGDFNNDGKPDLAVFFPGDTGTLAPGAFSILLGNGDGSFGAPKSTVLTVATDFVVADFNLDNKADIAVTDYDSNSASVRVLVFVGKGDGTFQAPADGPIVQSTLWGGGYFRYLVAEDFDNDAKPDLAVQVAGGVRIFLNHGDATFQTGPIAPVATDYTVQNVDAAEDVDGDGKNGSRCGDDDIFTQPFQ
jgi:FG-GAP-like repeat